MPFVCAAPTGSSSQLQWYKEDVRHTVYVPVTPSSEVWEFSRAIIFVAEIKSESCEVLHFAGSYVSDRRLI